MNYDPSNWFWTVNNDTTRFYSSSIRDYVTTLPEDAGTTNINSEQELWDVLKQQYPAGLPKSQNSVLKSVVMARLIAANQMSQAYNMLTQNPVYFARWFAPDRPEVNCDDPDAINFVNALGLDPNVILAP